MDQVDILNRVKRVVANDLGVDEKDIRPESRFTEDLKADSLDLVELVIAFEEEFESELQTAGVINGISDEEAERLASVQDVVDYILGRASA